MPVSGVSNTGSTSTVSLSQGQDIAEQKEMFLKLLVAQLKNQDPSSPMDQKDMMAQMAQFTSVEQLSNMSKNLEAMQTNATFTQSVGLIGKSVDYINADGGITEGGNVTAVSTAGSHIELVLDNGTKVLPSNVVMVR